MQERIGQFSQRLLPLLDRLLALLEWLARQFFKAWGWLNSLDIPLSPRQWIILFYLIFGVIFAVTTPVFEAEDELWHFGVIQYIRETGELPVQVFDGTDSVYQQHGSQPPLYYGIMSIITSPFSIEDVDSYRILNPHVTANQPDSFGNKNLVMHDTPQSMFEGTAFVVLLIRLIGLALGIVTIYAVYEIGTFIAPQRPTVAYVSAAFTGLNPMFIFVSASVNNDVLAMTLNSVAILLLLRVMRDGFSSRYSVLIAVLLALTMLTKMTSIVLLPVFIVAGYFIYRKNSDRSGFGLYLGAIVAFVLIIAGWWYVRNIQLYGELFGIFTMANIAGPRGVTFNLGTLLAEYQQFRMSYWGLFGAMNIQISPLFYLLVDLVTFFSILGFIFLIMQLLAIRDFAYARYELANLTVILVIFLVGWAGVFYWTTLTDASHGRVLFPLIATISPIIAVGFVEVVWWIVFSLRPPNLDFVRAGDAVPQALLNETMLWPIRFLGLIALLAPVTVIASQYAMPTPMTELPEHALPVYAEFGDVALVGYERVDRRYAPGETVPITLYWQVLEQSDTDNSIFMSLVDDEGQEIGHYSSYPGAGTLRTSKWQTGKIYADDYSVNLAQSAFGRFPFGLRIAWENLEEDIDIESTSMEGDNIAPVVLDIGAVVYLRAPFAPQGYVELPPEIQPNFGDGVTGYIRLRDFYANAGNDEVVLHWQAENTPDESYTVFVHVLDTDGNIIAQSDAPPRLSTKYWRWGETYLTYHKFEEDLEFLDYTVIVGWYLNDGLSFPRLEYTIVTDEGEEIKDSYALPWDLAIDVLELTEEATAEVTGEVTDEAGKPELDTEIETPEASRRPISGTALTDEPERTPEAESTDDIATTPEPERTSEAESTEES